MAITDEIKEQQKKIADMTRKEKWNYFWDYYKVHTIVAILVVVLLVFFIRDLVTGNQKSVFQAAIVNSEISVLEEGSEEAFETYLQINPKKEEVIFDNSYQLQLDSMDQATVASSQKMVANAQLKELDVIIAPDDVIAYYSENQFLGDISKLIPAEKFEELESKGRIVYEKREDGTRFPAGILIDDSPWIRKTGLYAIQKPVLGYVENTIHPENIQKFLDYIYTE
ncbi:MAG: hypothetical protein PHE02_04235 [Lachnospiraceae bacterium]|nr:hypothetical protein [Lachnospiraceae bacterium]